MPLAGGSIPDATKGRPPQEGHVRSDSQRDRNDPSQVRDPQHALAFGKVKSSQRNKIRFSK